MKSTQPTEEPKRAYRQGARAAAVEQTRMRMIMAFVAEIEVRWYDEITLDLVARNADVTVPTIIRHFGSKEGLLEASFMKVGETFDSRRAVAPGDVEGAVAVIIKEYERAGDIVMRLLAQEARFPVLKTPLDVGRANHRKWIETTFAPLIGGLPEAERARSVDGLVMALDIYTWQVVRRDMDRSLKHLHSIMLDLVTGVLRRPVEGADIQMGKRN